MAISNAFWAVFAGGIAGALIGLALVLLAAILIGLYVYFSLAWYTIARKLGHRHAWLAWIPIVKKALVLQLGEFPWPWVFLILIPILGWIALFVLLVIAEWRIFEKRKYPGWFSLSVLVPQFGFVLYAVALGFIAWEDRKKKLWA